MERPTPALCSTEPLPALLRLWAIPQFTHTHGLTSLEPPCEPQAGSWMTLPSGRDHGTCPAAPGSIRPRFWGGNDGCGTAGCRALIRNGLMWLATLRPQPTCSRQSDLVLAHGRDIGQKESAPTVRSGRGAKGNLYGATGMIDILPLPHVRLVPSC
jgi:hypothetical protein